MWNLENVVDKNIWGSSVDYWSMSGLQDRFSCRPIRDREGGREGGCLKGMPGICFFLSNQA